MINLGFALLVFPPMAMIVFFTNWALEVTFILNILVIWCSYDPKIESKKGLLAFIHILAEFATVFNVVTVGVYWTALHKGALIKFADEPLKILHMYLVHTFPAFSNLLIFATTDI